MIDDPNSPFNWRMRTEPSIFAKDVAFRPRSDGKTDSQRSSDVATERRKSGKDPVDLYALGKSGKSKQVREEELLAYKQFGVYTRAKPKRQPNKHEQ